MKVFICNLLWRIAKISSKIGNLVMDIIGYDNYKKVMKYHTKK